MFQFYKVEPIKWLKFTQYYNGSDESYTAEYVYDYYLAENSLMGAGIWYIDNIELDSWNNVFALAHHTINGLFYQQSGLNEIVKEALPTSYGGDLDNNYGNSYVSSVSDELLGNWWDCGDTGSDFPGYPASMSELVTDTGASGDLMLIELSNRKLLIPIEDINSTSAAIRPMFKVRKGTIL